MPSGGKKTQAKERRQVLVYLDPTLAKDLKLAAVKLDTNASAIAGEAIAAWLKKRGLLNVKPEDRS